MFWCSARNSETVRQHGRGEEEEEERGQRCKRSKTRGEGRACEGEVLRRGGRESRKHGEIEGEGGRQNLCLELMTPLC